jgi:hypothetical protein
MNEFVITNKKRGLWIIITKTFSLCVFILALTCTDAIAQELIITAPFGKPAMVMDEVGNYSAAILVYSDSEVEIFIPDITTPGWIWWHGPAFREKGTYQVYLYEHFIKDSFCRRELIPAEHKADPNWLEMCSELRYRRRYISADTRKKTVAVRESISMESTARYNPAYVKEPNLTFRFSELKKPTRLSVARITAIIEKEVKPSVNRQSTGEPPASASKPSEPPVFSSPPAKGDFPIRTGAINDFARVIPPDYKNRMEDLAREVLEKTGTAIVVVSMESIGDNKPTDYVNSLYKAWGIGKKGEDKGVLIFVSLKEQKFRIVTGYGVKGILPDGLVHEISERYAIPYFMKGAFGRGLSDTVTAVASVVAKNANVTLTELPVSLRPTLIIKGNGANVDQLGY